jgi:transposase
MNRISNDLRKAFFRMQKMGKKVTEIAQILGVKRQTIHKWKKIDENQLLIEPSKNTRKPPFQLGGLKEYIQKNPFAFNKEVAIILKTNKTNIQRWRKKLGLTRKITKTSYKEADLELKKSF